MTKKTIPYLTCSEELALALGAHKLCSADLGTYCIVIKSVSEQGEGTLIWPTVFDGFISVTSKGIKITS